MTEKVHSALNRLQVENDSKDTAGSAWEGNENMLLESGGKMSLATQWQESLDSILQWRGKKRRGYLKLLLLAVTLTLQHSRSRHLFSTFTRTRWRGLLSQNGSHPASHVT
jgi:hypothetical protein